MKNLNLLIFIPAFLYSCVGNEGRGKEESNFPDGSKVTMAEHFSIKNTDSCTILTISSPWQGAERVEHVHYLVRKNEKPILQVPENSVIEVPVKKIICMSSTHLAMIAAIGEQKSIAGISGTKYVYDKSIRTMIDSGLIKDVGYDSGINSELILSISPDVIMMYGIGNESSAYISRITGLGTKVIYNADYLEYEPLAKAEWIKVFGALYCREELADSIFQSICTSYNEIKEFVDKNISEKPSVILGLPYRDTWFISPGNSYINTLISDAGGYYLWNDTRSDFSMPHSIESVYIKSLKADFWLNAGNAASKKEIAEFDGRLEKIPSFIKGKIYNNTRRMSTGGGNDYWESGTLNPHLILKDIASILHPDIFRDHKLVYYIKIE